MLKLRTEQLLVAFCACLLITIGFSTAQPTLAEGSDASEVNISPEAEISQENVLFGQEGRAVTSRSINTTTCSQTFVNNTNDRITIWWVDSHGNHHHYKTLYSGYHWSVYSNHGHHWVVKDRNYNHIYSYTVNQCPHTVQIGGSSNNNSIGDFVWLDQDGDGFQENGEPGVDNVTVNLWEDSNCNDTPDSIIDTQQTNNGYYNFDNLPDGCYIIQVELPDGYSYTEYDAGGNNYPEVDSDINPALGYTKSQHLDHGEHVTTIDAGLIQQSDCPVCINGVEQVTIKLAHRTNGGDRYETIRVRENNINGAVLYSGQLPNVGDNFTIDVTPGSSIVITVQGNNHPHEYVKAAFDLTCGLHVGQTSGNSYITFKIHDLVYDNADGAACFNPEPGINIEKTVYLGHDGGASCPGSENATDFANTPVTYCFEVTNTGNTYLDVDEVVDNDLGITVPVDALLAPDESVTVFYEGMLDSPLVNVASVEGVPTDENGDPLPGVDPVTDDDDASVDVLPPGGAIGDTVWFDEDGDGVQGLGEDGISGVTVILTDEDGNQTTVQTGPDGMYLFDELAGGEYTVSIDTTTLPEGLIQTYDADGTVATPDASTVTIANGGVNLDQDFGYQTLGSIGDTVWIDTNGNGIQEAGEDGIPGVTVTLLDSNGGTVSNVQTDPDGEYLFAGLEAGDYTVVIDPMTLPDGLVQTYDADGIVATPNQSTYSLGASEDNLDQDFGYQYLGAIGDRVWFDEIDPITGEANGVIDPAEAGIDGVEVVLWTVDANGDPLAVVDQTTTADGGYYAFTGLAEGEYIVQIPATEFQAGEPLFQLISTFGNGNIAPDPDDDVDSDDNGTPAGELGTLTAPVTIAYGTEPTDDDETGIAVIEPDANSNKTVDLGFTSIADRVAVGGTIWADSNSDGVISSGEQLLNGVEVTLFKANGTSPAEYTDGTLIEPTLTDFQGRYSWDGLKEGEYVVVIEPVNGYELSPVYAGDPDTNPTVEDNNGITCSDRSSALRIPCNFAHSDSFVLSHGAEPLADGQMTGNDADGNLTVGFGLVQAVPTAVEMNSTNTTTSLIPVIVAVFTIALLGSTSIAIRRD